MKTRMIAMVLGLLFIGTVNSSFAEVDMTKFQQQMLKQSTGDYSGSIPWVSKENKKAYDNDELLKSKFTPNSFAQASNLCKTNFNNGFTGSIKAAQYIQLCENTAKLAEIMSANDIRKFLYIISELELSDKDKEFKGQADTERYKKIIMFVGAYSQSNNDGLISTISTREVDKHLHILNPIYSGKYDDFLKIIRAVDDKEIKRTINVSES